MIIKSLFDTCCFSVSVFYMSRPLRIQFPGAWYHVMNRVRRGEEVFSGSENFKTFIALLQESAEL